MKPTILNRVQAALAPILPRRIKDNRAVRYIHAKLLVGRIPNEKNVILLHTQYKSGSHYFRFLLTNYLLIHFDGMDEPVGYETMQACFPNGSDDLHSRFKSYIPPHRVIHNTPYVDFVFGHDHTGIEFSPATIIVLYRNPLDYIVSNYYYRYRNRSTIYDKPASPAAIVDLELPYMVKTYTLLGKLVRKRNVLGIAYEELIRYPEATFGMAIRWLGLPFDVGHLRKAIGFSSFETIRRYEEKHGHIVAGDNYEGFFTRSGKIGEWKDELSKECVADVRTRLERNGIPFSQFVLE